MSKFLTVIFIAMISASYAQPSINGPILGGFGGSYTLKGFVATGFDEGLAGENITWNFSDLHYSAELNDYYIVNPAITGYTDLFPDANVAISTGEGSGIYSFYTDNTSEFSLNGAVAGATQIVYDDPEQLFIFPLTYGLENDDNLHTTFVSGVTIDRNGSVSMDVDGYGTLILPGATYSNALRVHLHETYSDVAAGITINYDNHLYYWMVPGTKGPAMQYFNLTTTSAGSETTTESGFVNTNIPTLTENISSEPAWYCYPNPASDYIIVSLPSAEVEQIILTNMAGNSVEKINAIGNVKEVNINVNNLPKGIYMITLRLADNKTSSSKIVIN